MMYNVTVQSKNVPNYPNASLQACMTGHTMGDKATIFCCFCSRQAANATCKPTPGLCRPLTVMSL